MPGKKTMRRAQQDRRQGKAASTQAGEFVREEIHHVRQGKHGARSSKQAIAIGLSKSRRAGVALPPPKRGSSATRSKARQDTAASRKSRKQPAARRSKAVSAALKREPRAAMR